ncbi:MAG: DUF1273 domain-containing protein [Paenibacillaceae bacterium]|nr:DUF1273 domain-containing protein [Paenibacillaceae bacterium]
MINRLLIAGYKASELGIFSPKHPGVAIIKQAVKSRLLSLQDEGLEWVIVSGQWGVEVWAAEAAIELKQAGWGLQLAVITPFLEQEENWSDDKKDRYLLLLQQADYVNSVTKTKYAGPWQFRAKDTFLLRNSDGLLLVYDEENEGSPKYIKELALREGRSRDYPLLRIGAEELQTIADEQRDAATNEYADYDDT